MTVYKVPWSMSGLLILREILYTTSMNRRFSFNTQDIIKTARFFVVVGELDRLGMINVCKDRSRRYYTLTDRGRMIANELAKDSEMKYRFLGTRKYIEWES